MTTDAEREFFEELDDIGISESDQKRWFVAQAVFTTGDCILCMIDGNPHIGQFTAESGNIEFRNSAFAEMSRIVGENDITVNYGVASLLPA